MPANFRTNGPKTYKFIAKNSLDNTSAYCTYCKCSFSVAAGGKNDISRHCNGKKHVDIARAVASSSKLHDHFPVGNEEIDKVSSVQFGL